MSMTFDPPGHLDDLSPAHRQAWHAWISKQMDEVQIGTPAANDGPRTQFFNEAKTQASADAVTEEISWPAFPRQIQIRSVSDVQRWRRADASRDVQDEYCEWSVTRDADDRITRVDFTCEGPEYWSFLAHVQPDTVLALYRAHVDAAVSAEDLYPGGVYDRTNRWNATTSGGAMHLIQAANSLHAEIELAAGASIVRIGGDGQPLTGAADLIRCGRYGAPERNSDPHIGDRVNAHARNRADITLANPVGLYFDSIDLTGFETPDESDPAALVRYTRGSDGHHVRMVVEAPAGSGFVLGEVTINGRGIDFGAQITDCIRIKLVGLVTRIGQSAGRPVAGCVGDAPRMESAVVPSVEAAIASQERARGRR